MTTSRRRRWLLVWFGLILPACSGTVPTEPADPALGSRVGAAVVRDGLASQSGRVLDFRTNAPIPGARIVFGTWDAGGPVHTAVADAAGVYHIDLPAADYLVSVDGVAAAAITARLPSDRAHIYARAEGCSALYGFINDARSGEPLAGASVDAVGRSATSSADGWYRLDFGCGVNLGFGTTVATFSHAAFDRSTRVIGRGVPSGARRMDVGLLRPAEETAR